MLSDRTSSQVQPSTSSNAIDQVTGTVASHSVHWLACPRACVAARRSLVQHSCN